MVEPLQQGLLSSIYNIVNSEDAGVLTTKTKRVRRRPEEARVQILDAAERIMTKGGGPASLRLQDVAKLAGLSHPTILHHFGSREGLVRALNLRAVERLTDATLSGLSDAQSSTGSIEKTFAAYRDGLAQRTVWLLQSADKPPDRTALFDDVVEKFHQLRQQIARPGEKPDIADSRAIIHLTTIAAFGDALIGARLRQAGAKEPAARRDFERWYGALLDMFLRAKA
jgi:AcrR family transcriptional regulator